jgi:hypothetical protein
MPPQTAEAASDALHRTPAEPCASPAFALGPRPLSAEAQALNLAAASRALWSATLALMTAFMQTPAPAHRHLLARRISRNFDTLSGQECFDRSSRASFERLAGRWHARADQYAPQPARSHGFFELLS